VNYGDGDFAALLGMYVGVGDCCVTTADYSEAGNEAGTNELEIITAVVDLIVTI